MTRSIALLSAAALIAGAIAFTAPSWAQAQDSAISAARSAGQVGEQADGYLGFVAGASISADLRGRVEQNNIRQEVIVRLERDAQDLLDNNSNLFGGPSQ